MTSLFRKYGVTTASIAKWIKNHEVIETNDDDMTKAEVQDLKKELTQKLKRNVIF